MTDKIRAFIPVILSFLVLLPAGQGQAATCASQRHPDQPAVVYIFAGKGADVLRAPYTDIAAAWSAQGIRPVLVDVAQPEDLSTYLDLIRDFIDRDLAGEEQQIHFYGFSLGALAAISLSAEFQPLTTVAASPAVFFRENYDQTMAMTGWQGNIYKMWYPYGRDEVPVLGDALTAIRDGAPRTRIITFAGELDDFRVIHNSEQIAAAFPQPGFWMVPGTPHNQSAPAYLDAVNRAISCL